MIQALLPGALAFTMLASQMSPAPLLSPISSRASSSAQQKLVWMVKSEDTLKIISQKYYGDEKFWTTLWNDNNQVADPNQVNVGTLLAIRPTPPQEVEDLSSKIIEQHPEFVENEKPQKKIVSIPLIQAASISATISPELSTPTILAPSVAESAPNSLTDSQITFLGNCEAGMNPTRNSGNGYYGAFQFSYGTWKSMGTAYERADLAPIEVQIDAVRRLVARSSLFTQFPACAKAMQAAGIL
jgi:LysM repeat protein